MRADGFFLSIEDRGGLGGGCLWHTGFGRRCSRLGLRRLHLGGDVGVQVCIAGSETPTILQLEEQDMYLYINWDFCDLILHRSDF